jgi:uncharacterized protein (DUF433 family)
MKRSIELDEESLKQLHIWREIFRFSEQETLSTLCSAFLTMFRPAAKPEHADIVIIYKGSEIALELVKDAQVEPIRSRPEVMGGDACIRNTRIPVWALIDYKRQGLTDAQLLDAFPSLNASDLTAAWDYYAAHSQEVDAQRRRHEDAA